MKSWSQNDWWRKQAGGLNHWTGELGIRMNERSMDGSIDGKVDGWAVKG